MEYIYPLIGGIAAKLYDDIVDEGFEVNETFKEALKGVQWITLALTSIGDFNYSIFMYLINIFAYLGDPEPYKFPYEFSLLCVYPILIVLSFHTRTSFTKKDYYTILLVLLGVFFESNFIPENIYNKNEVNYYKKLISRFIFLLLMFMSVLFATVLNRDYSLLIVSTFVLKLMFYAMGYVATSCLFQVYLINKGPPVKEAPVKEAPVKEAPVKEAPVKEAPVKEAPVKEASVKETPVKE